MTLKTHRLLIFTLLALILAAGEVFAAVALDPSVVGVGARALGMGRAYVAAAGEPDSIFLNPAALNDLSRWGMTSMYNKLISEVDYILLGGVYPSEIGKLGVGFVGASIGGLQVAHLDPGTGLITFEPGSVSYYNNVYFLSYGTEIFKSLTAGASLKFYYQGYSNNMDAGHGYDADLGLLYRPIEGLSIGFLQRNFLPASLGAKVKWDSGPEESLATSSRLGINYLLGDYNFNADYEIYPTLSKPGVLKLGAEWWVSPAFAVRAGTDQDPLETNLTAGLSFLYSGFKFDYAYHQYGSISTNTTHTFSLSYGIFKEVGKEYITINNPPDKSIVFNPTITVEGLVLADVRQLKANGKEVPVQERGGFRYLNLLALGKNRILLSAYSAREKLLEEKKIRVLRLKEFTDVPPDHWARVPISILAMENIVSGYPDGRFKPAGNITRAEMCSMLSKLRPSSLVLRPLKFKDVSNKHWAAKSIAQAVAEGAVKGYPNKTFKPNSFITRAEGVAIIARFAKLPQAAVLESPFFDVPGRFWAAREILSAQEAGLLKYLEDKPFQPNKKLTRAEVVEILSRTGMIAPKVDEVLDFERGY